MPGEGSAVAALLATLSADVRPRLAFIAGCAFRRSILAQADFLFPIVLSTSTLSSGHRRVVVLGGTLAAASTMAVPARAIETFLALTSIPIDDGEAPAHSNRWILTDVWRGVGGSAMGAAAATGDDHHPIYVLLVLVLLATTLHHSPTSLPTRFIGRGRRPLTQPRSSGHAA